MSSLPTLLRRQLENAIKQARKIAAGGAVHALEALAVHEPDPYRHMNEAHRDLRRKLRAQARQLGDGESPTRPRAYEIRHLVEKLAYDQWHRLLFARFLLENNLLISPEHDVSVTLEDCEELAPSLGLKDGWGVAARFAAQELPEIFRADDPAGAVELPVEDRNPLIQLVTGLPVEVFTASDSLGWCYQFWQAEQKDRVNAAGNKIGADELSAVTQLFTEDYMVQFLLDNTVGAWWWGRQGIRGQESGISEADARRAVAVRGVDWEYLRFVREGEAPAEPLSPREGEAPAEPDFASDTHPRDDGSAGASPSRSRQPSTIDHRPFTPAAGTFDGWPRTLKEFRFLDPCCGSGHFLVGAFHLLVPLRMHEEGLSAREACDAVLRENLFGLELDPRCTQIAAFALALAAWKFPGCLAPTPSAWARRGSTIEDAHADGVGAKQATAQPLGYRILPPLNIACTGIGPQASEEEWLKLAEQSGPRMNAVSRGPILEGLRNLHTLFSNAPTLGSLIDPNRSSADLFTADYETLKPYLSVVLKSEPSDDAAHERAVAAAGMVKAAELLAGEYTLVITNVPYLGRGKQDDTLKQHLEQHYPHSKADLATAFVERCLEFCAKHGTTALVTPQNWLFLTTYTKLRESLLKQQTWNLVARLGPGAFETISGEVVNAALTTLSAAKPDEAASIVGIDVSAAREATEKAALLRNEVPTDIAVIPQSEQLRNPDSRIVLQRFSPMSLLSEQADTATGQQTFDSPRFLQCAWEQNAFGTIWSPSQSTVEDHENYGGRQFILRWEEGIGDLYKLMMDKERDGYTSGIWKAGSQFWGRRGVLISLMGALKSTLYTGVPFDNNTGVLIPRNDAMLAPIWCFCTDERFLECVRSLDQKMNVTNSTLAKVPFDLAYWQQVAAEKYPDGLPEPESDDPTQWLFHGRPEWSTAPLQVAVARLLGYRWPAEHSVSGKALAAGGSEGPAREQPAASALPLTAPGGDEHAAAPMRLSARARELVQRCDELLPHADADGIVCLSATKGEVHAAERLRALLSQALGPFDVSALLASAGLKGSKSETLEEWLRDEFFEQHCALFHNRPFIWHIWDGHKSGFSVLVNYHKLDHANLEKLTYAYLGDWIRRQQAAVDANESGSDARLAAAKLLQTRLKLILEGESPYDIFVRWKPLSQQAIGWHPDLNDGVRMNIRPFLAQDLPGGKKGAGLLRTKPNIKWEKDRGKEPQRDKAEFPWFWKVTEFTGDRVNDVHLSLAQKAKE